jgi:Transcriptional regulator
MDTKKAIIETSVSLFNEYGISAVSTNHIAKKMGISPGNLYYHFRNKEEIIRAIYDEMIAFMNVDDLLRQSEINLDGIKNLFGKAVQLNYQYRFFYNSIVELLKGDEKLLRKYTENRAQRKAEYIALIDALAETGILILGMTKETKEKIFDQVWFISEFWVVNLNITGEKLEKAGMDGLLEMIFKMFLPFLTEKGSEMMDGFQWNGRKRNNLVLIKTGKKESSI